MLWAQPSFSQVVGYRENTLYFSLYIAYIWKDYAFLENCSGKKGMYAGVGGNGKIWTLKGVTVVDYIEIDLNIIADISMM